MAKTITLGEAQMLLRWFNDFRNNKINDLTIKTQWDIFSNIKLVKNDVVEFEKFVDKISQNLKKDYFNEKKSDKVQAKGEDGNLMFDENGNQIMMWKVKPEYMEEYHETVDKIDESVSQVIAEKKTYDFKEIDIDTIINKLSSNTSIELADLEMISLMR